MSSIIETPADLLLRDVQILDVFSGRFRSGDVALRDGRICGYGAQDTQTVRDMHGAWVVPALIDAHVHLESAQVVPSEFARAVLPHGTTAVIADPHEIANVLGLSGVRLLLEASEGLPLRVWMMAPSCVPASLLETAGAVLGADEIAEMLTWPRVLGLGEVMNVPGVLHGDPDMLGKLKAAQGRPIDGHAPGVSGPDLWAYVSAGPKTDHECTTLEEAQEKLSCGMHILIREGTVARNFDALRPLLSPQTAPYVHFCTDDRHADTLLQDGHIDDLVRRAIAAGVPAPIALAAASLHTARAYGLSDLGAIAPGYHADLLVLSDLETFAIDEVYAAGVLVAKGGTCVAEIPPSRMPGAEASVHVDPASVCLRIPADPDVATTARAIRVLPEQVLTEEVHVPVGVDHGEALADPSRDLLKLAVIERHHATGRVGLAFVQGFGLSRGALASTVAHDSHNLVVVGANDEDMRAAVTELARMGGGQVVVEDGTVVAALRLPIAGLLSDEPIERVASDAQALDDAAERLGCVLPSPFMTLSFVALPVIPHLKLTDRGLVDADAFRIVDPIVASP